MQKEIMEVNENDVNCKSKLYKDVDTDEILIEKGTVELKEKESIQDSLKVIDSVLYNTSEHKKFDYETLNKDLADIEERLRQTRLSWNKNSRTSTQELCDIDSRKGGAKKSWSMLDIDRRTFSSASSGADGEKYDGQKCESPAISEGLLKWDYGADIGLDQEDSGDEMEPITWPVTAEEAHRNEKDAINRRMKQSLSQGSFIASPDPEDRHNLMNKISMEYKSKNTSSSQNLHNRRQYNSFSTLSDGKFSDVSARQIMEQAEAAERRLRERLQAVKAIHLNGKALSREELVNEDVKEASDLGTSNLQKISDYSSKPNKEEFAVDSLASPQNPITEDFHLETNRSNAADERSRSPTSISNTGRTTTIESTHTFSDYGKAPLFQPETYGTRNDYLSTDKNISMYSRKSKDKSLDKGRTVCGIAPELDTISSRETLHMTDDKKENSKSSTLSRQEEEPHIYQHLKEKQTNDLIETSKNLRHDAPQEESLQVKWDRFKSMRNDDDLDEQLFEKTTLRTATQYNPQNSHRQYSSSNTFTTITNVSPRYDSFSTETFKSPIKDYIQRDNAQDNYDSTGDRKTKKATGKISPIDEEKKHDYHFTSNVQARPSRRIVGGNGGRKDDDEDDEDISQTEKRRIRHAGQMKKLKKKFGSGQLDGETTASELEHDDASKYRQNSNEKGGHCQQLSHMLTKLSRRAVARGDEALDDSNHSNSTSVDTMQLMDRMSNLLGKRDVGNHNGSSSKQWKKKFTREPVNAFTETVKKRQSEIINYKHPHESEDGMLVLKHLMLKQKVKWLADCAREEARRRKVKKLQKLIDMYEDGDRILIPSDLETDTATLMGSERGSQLELDSQSDSYTQYEEVTPTNFKPQPKPKPLEPNNRISKPKAKKTNVPHRVEEKKSYPTSEAWHIPLRENHNNTPEDVNASNFCDDSGQRRHGKPTQQYKTPYSHAESNYQEKSVNLTSKERVRMKYEFELARQRNARECQKDMRHTRSGNTKVAGGGISWAVGSGGNEQVGHGKEMSDFNVVENMKEKGSCKSELQIAFENSMEGFISRSRQRQKRIKLAADDRRYESQMNMERARLFVDGGSSSKVVKRRSITQPDPLSENLYKPRRRKFSKTEMKVQSARKYQALPEVQAKYMDERRKSRIQNNRMRMQLYGERVLQSLLRNRGPWVSECR